MNSQKLREALSWLQNHVPEGWHARLLPPIHLNPHTGDYMFMSVKTTYDCPECGENFHNFAAHEIVCRCGHEWTPTRVFGGIEFSREKLLLLKRDEFIGAMWESLFPGVPKP